MQLLGGEEPVHGMHLTEEPSYAVVAELSVG
jgi:hypothetical protein